MSDDDPGDADDGLREGLERAGQAVAERRGQLHLTQGELAERAGINVSTLREIEQGIVPKRGRHRATLAQLSDALEWEPDQIRLIAEGAPPPWRGNAERLSAVEGAVTELRDVFGLLSARLDALEAPPDA
ncbi:MAG: helix-turn-helix domain-containing protein [Actinomycetes bacterium]